MQQGSASQLKRAAACLCVSQAMLQRQRLAAEAVEQEQKEEEFHLQQAQVGQGCFRNQVPGLSRHDAIRLGED